MYSPDEDFIKTTELYKFQETIEEKYNLKFSNYSDFHSWSVENNEDFWKEFLLDSKIIYSGSLEPVAHTQSFLEYPWFPKVKLNFAENLLAVGDDADIAITSFHESGKKVNLNYKNLKKDVASLQNNLIKMSFSKGDVLACYMPNISETVVSMLACTSLGGVFTSTSPDFGVDGVIDRFGQSRPKVLVMAAGYEYGSKYFDMLPKIPEILTSIDSIEKIIVVNFLEKEIELNHPQCIFWKDLNSENKEITFEKVNFSDPLFIMYSSGTTGKPKCIVHSVGGTLLQHLKELRLHTNLKKKEKILYFTTCGWMMWNWLISSLAIGAEVVLYEGSPAYPSLDAFMKVVDAHGVQVWGTSPKFLRALDIYEWKNKYEFTDLRSILSTGAPLLAEQFDYIDEKIKKDVHIASICGGTDIISCFMLGVPTKKVIRGEIQGLGLGMDVRCFDSFGNSVIDQEDELVCVKPFVSQPIYFLNDEKKLKIKNAYFNKFEDIWHHGDFVTITSDGGVKVFGRSDATLNPGGVRIGTGEIYRQTEKISFIDDSICVGKNIDGDVEVVLFVKTKNHIELSDMMKKEIKKTIKAETTPRHVPKHVIQVNDIPYTRSGKKMEVIINRIINGKKIDNLEAVSNPESLKGYESFNENIQK